MDCAAYAIGEGRGSSGRHYTGRPFLIRYLAMSTRRILFSQRRCAAALLPLALALAGCGADDPAAATQTMGRSAASLASSATTIVVSPEEAYANALQHLYVAYFGRPAETTGMQYWSRQLLLAGAPLDAVQMLAQYRNGPARFIVDAFSSSQETRELYPGDTAQFVDGVYRNLFNRSADRDGLAYWSNAIDRAVITRAEAALMIMLGARNEDALGVRNKIAVAHTFYRLVNERVQTVLGYTGTRNNEIARRMLAQVDAKTDLAAFEPVIRATVAQMEVGLSF